MKNDFRKRDFFAACLALLVALAALAASASAQTPAARQAVPLPASDAVLMVDLRRLLNEAVPRALAGDAARLAQVNADVEQFKARTGIDARAFDTLAVGARFTAPAQGVTKIDHVVALARGSYRMDVLVAAGRVAAGGRLAEQKHGGRTIYVFNLSDHVKLFGLLRLRVRDLAVTALDSNTLAVGEPEAVRAALDAQGGRGAVDPGLLEFASAPGQLVGFAGRMPRSLVEDLDLGMPDLNRSVASIQSFYGSLGMTPAGFQMLTVLRTQNATDAQKLAQTAEALKQVAPALIGMAGRRGEFAKNAIGSLQIVTQGADVRLSTELAQGDITALLRIL